MKQTVKNINERNLNVLEKFFTDMQSIIYAGGSKKYQLKRLHTARYWTWYAMALNCRIAEQELTEK